MNLPISTTPGARPGALHGPHLPPPICSIVLATVEEYDDDRTSDHTRTPALRAVFAYIAAVGNPGISPTEVVVSMVNASVEPILPTGARTDAERLALLALSCIKGVGHKTLHAIARSGRRFRNVLEISRTEEAIELLRSFGARIEGSSNADWSKVRQQAFERASRLAEEFSTDHTGILFQEDPAFPRALLDLPNPPYWLFIRGHAEILQRSTLAIVGTREPSDDGRFLTQYVGACLPEWAAPTVSGLAVGIDQLIHQFSLRAKVPTVAVLGTGIQSDYPRGAADLKEQIVAQGGALVTEYLQRESYSAQNFVMRNRLQAALARLLIPVEWDPRGGTAHTVRFATSLRRPIACLRMPDWKTSRLTLSKGLGLETGRVFTIPGEEAEFPLLKPRSMGRRPKFSFLFFRIG